jgi:hypothetical protein
MKNVHVLPTDILKIDRKTQTLWTNSIGQFLHTHSSSENLIPYNIYITSDEELKQVDWCLDINKNIIILWSHPHTTTTPFFKKIILTTDQDLIKDGVQEIDDEFLEWFIKNPSCEMVELEATTFPNEEGIPHCYDGYKIIIPKS